MRRVEIGEEQTHHNRFDCGLGQRLRDSVNLPNVDFLEHFAVGSDALRQFLPESTRDQGLGLHVRDVIERLRRTGDSSQLENVAKTLGCDESSLCAAPLYDRVRPDRAAVSHEAHVATIDFESIRRLAQPGDCRIGDALRGGGNLGNPEFAGFLVEHDDIGKRAPDVYADALHGSSVPDTRALALRWSIQSPASGGASDFANGASGSATR